MSKYMEQEWAIGLFQDIFKRLDSLEQEKKCIKEKNEMEVNLNDWIKVKLNDRGKDIYYHRFDDVIKEYPQYNIKPSMPKVDENGYTRFQMWNFMEIYGEHMGMAKLPVLETLNVIIGEN